MHNMDKHEKNAAKIMYSMPGLANHKIAVEKNPRIIRKNRKFFLLSFLSEQLPIIGLKSAVKIPEMPKTNPQINVPSSIAIELTKYTEKINVVCMVGIGEVPQSNNINETKRK